MSNVRGRTGRPTKFTPDIRAKIINFIKAGNYLETSCQAAGINYSTFRNWMVRGEKERNRLEASSRAKEKETEKDFLQFLEDVEKAEAEAEARNLMIINSAAKDSWQAAAWYLERKHSERWGRKDRVQADMNHSGNVDGDINVKIASLSIADLRGLANLDDDHT